MSYQQFLANTFHRRLFRTLAFGAFGTIGYIVVNIINGPKLHKWCREKYTAHADTKDIPLNSPEAPKFSDEEIEIYRNDFRNHMSTDAKPGDLEQALKNLTGNTFSDTVLDQSKDVFVEFYAPDCHACASFAVILRYIAEAASDVPTLVVGKLDGVNNYVPGVLTMDEEGVYPTMKMFPATVDKKQQMEDMAVLAAKVQQEISDIVAARARGESPAIVTSRLSETGVGQAVAMVGGADYSWNMFVDFMHERAAHKFDKEAVKARLAARLPEMIAEVLAASAGKQKEAFQQCGDAIPCGAEWEALYDVIRLKGVGAAKRDDIMEAVWATKSCISDKRDEIRAFYSSMDRFSQENMNILHDIEGEEARLAAEGVNVAQARELNKADQNNNAVKK